MRVVWWSGVSDLFRRSFQRSSKVQPTGPVQEEQAAASSSTRGARPAFRLRSHGSERVAREETARRLAGCSRAFAERSAGTERGFVELGGTLRALFSTGAELAGLVNARAGGLRQALTESRIAGAEGLAALSMREVRAGFQETTRVLATLKEVETSLLRLETQARGVERIGVFLRSSVFSFAIESSRTPECQHAFGSFVEELRGLAARVSSVAESIQEQVRGARASQAGGIQMISASLEGMRKISDRLEGTAGQTADEAQQLLDASVAIAQEAEDRSRRIAREVDEAVYHLQFGDIVRQKLEHVTEALEKAAARLKEGTDASFGAEAAGIDNSIAVQISQLDMIRQEVLTAHGKLAAAFQRITEETDGLAEALSRWSVRGGGEEGGLSAQDAKGQPRNQADPLEALRGDARQMEELRQQGGKLRGEAHATAQRTVEASSQLEQHLEQVKTINADMHLEALNAIIKTAALGERGATLEVLSMQVDSLFGESSRTVAEIVGTLEAILDGAQAAMPSADAANASGDGAGRSDFGLRVGLDRIDGVCGEFTLASAQATNLAGKQRESLAGSRAALDFLGGLAESIADQAKDLSGLRDLIAPWKAKGGEAAPMEMLDGHYTMQSEREVHRRASGGDAEAAPPAAAPPAAQGVEFFQLSASSSAPSEPAPDGNMEFFDTPGPPAQPATEPTKEMASNADKVSATPGATENPAGPALGDNVELF